MRYEEITEFASWERATDAEIAATALEADHDPTVRAMLEVIEGDCLILDDHRQIVAANRSFLERVGQRDAAPILGLRPGECLDCAKVTEAPSGCGTGKACRSCGAALTIVTSQRTGQATTGECLMSLGESGHEAAEFRVRCTPLRVDGHDLTAMVLHDISAEKRRQVLERLFLHDISNTVGGIVGWSALLAQDDVDAHDAADQIVSLARRLTREIKGHKTLIAAEEGELRVAPEQLRPRDQLRQLVGGFRGVRNGEVRVELDEHGDDRPFLADPEIFSRVLGNMVLNAVEASRPGDVVRVRYESDERGPTFYVHNPAVMPENVRHQVFKRSFTTKGRGRGLGTYGMKLFGERYLGGDVGFTSEPGSGTTFWLALGRRTVEGIGGASGDAAA
ncbi:MAG: sensor histidine kinase [Deltaproteobacteria bacterium]|nr:MAG: sensor histidine kinase [Deltaproteobacteria bacterium]